MLIEEVIAKVFWVPAADVSDHSSHRTIPRWDSLGHISLILELERQYGILLSPQDALGATDVAAIKKLLRRYGVSNDAIAIPGA